MMERDTVKRQLAEAREDFRLTQSEQAAKKCERLYNLLKGMEKGEGI